MVWASQNWTNFENIQKISHFSMDFDNFCSFFEYHSILAEKQRTKQTNYSSLSLSASLDTQDTLHGGMIVKWKKFRQEIPVCLVHSTKVFFLHFASKISEILCDLYDPPLSLLARVPIYSMLVSNCRKWNIFSLSFTVLELEGATQELCLLLDHSRMFSISIRIQQVI